MNKGYTKIPNELLDTCDLSIQARYLLCVLLRHNSGTGKCFPTQITLGKEIGRSSKQVRVILNELINANAITKKQRGFNRSNDYFISKKYIVKNLPATKAKKYSDQTKSYTQKRYKSTSHKNADDLLNSKQEIVKDNRYFEKLGETKRNLNQILSSDKPSEEAKKIYSISNKGVSYQVYNQKTRKLESVREIIESKTFNRDTESDVHTGHMIDSSNHMVSNDLDPTLTKSKSNSPLDKDSINVDSQQKGEKQ